MRVVCVGGVPRSVVGLLRQDHIVDLKDRADASVAGADFAIVADSDHIDEDLQVLAGSGPIPFSYWAERVDDDRLVSVVLRHPCESVIEGTRPRADVVAAALRRLGLRAQDETGEDAGLKLASYVTVTGRGVERQANYRRSGGIALVSASTQAMMRTLRSSISAMDRFALPSMPWDPTDAATPLQFNTGGLPVKGVPPLSQLFSIGPGEDRAKRLGMGLEDERRTAYPQPGMALIRGESGTGKSLIAHLMWRAFSASDRWTANNGVRRMPWVKINCGAMDAENFDHEMFGSAPKKFTDISEPVVGLLAQADYGVAFLDEIGDLDQSAQSRLKAVLDDMVIRPFGMQPYYLHLRVIAATNVALESSGFQHDLFRRFAFTIDVPPLNERREEIPRLVDYAAQNPMINAGGRDELLVTHVSARAMTLLREHDWSHGNYRELAEVIGRAVFSAAQANRTMVQLHDVQQAIRPKSLPADGQRVVSIRAALPEPAVEVRSADDLWRASLVHGVPILRFGDQQWVRTTVGTYVWSEPDEKGTQR